MHLMEKIHVLAKFPSSVSCRAIGHDFKMNKLTVYINF